METQKKCVVVYRLQESTGIDDKKQMAYSKLTCILGFSCFSVSFSVRDDFGGLVIDGAT